MSFSLFSEVLSNVQLQHHRVHIRAAVIRNDNVITWRFSSFSEILVEIAGQLMIEANGSLKVKDEFLHRLICEGR